ncbi:MAG: TIGR02301 family protein [Beijerinckiaceae bacterium]|nr:TIGR02301 family protein [Beijerinckiaceae bacterium]
MRMRKAAATQRLKLTARVACMALCLAAWPANGAFAQTRTAPPQGANAAPPLPTPEPLESPPPYERQLLRLAEILGALAWLTELCGDRPGDQWRQQMATLMEAEAATTRRRERLAGSYNRGFRGYSAMHRRCTPSAQLVITRFLDEGGRIARDVANRFSG